jgi:hypothetical protein
MIQGIYVVLPIVSMEHGGQRIECSGYDSVGRFFDIWIDDIPEDVKELMWQHWTHDFMLPEIRIVGDQIDIKGDDVHTLINPRFDAYIWR